MKAAVAARPTNESGACDGASEPEQAIHTSLPEGWCESSREGSQRPLKIAVAHQGASTESVGHSRPADDAGGMDTDEILTGDTVASAELLGPAGSHVSATDLGCPME